MDIAGCRILMVDSGLNVAKLVALNQRYCQHSSRKILELFSLIESPEDFKAYVTLLLSKVDIKQADELLELAEKESVQIITLLDSAYPLQLLSIADPPLVLYLRGEIACLSGEEYFSVVGSRRATSYGLRVAEKLGEYFQLNGITTVSGLALGIDAASHWGVLRGAESLGEPARGLAVLGSGVLAICPKTNEELGEKLLEKGGAIISEYGLKTSPQKHFYPRRNRIVCGLSTRLIVVEAAERSGTLISARLALEQGRDVLVVPGSILSEAAVGSNKLLSEGAEPLVCFEQLIPAESRRNIPAADTESLELSQKVVFGALSIEALSFSQIGEKLQLDSGELRLALSVLEMNGLIVENRGVFSVS